MAALIGMVGFTGNIFKAPNYDTNIATIAPDVNAPASALYFPKMPQEQGKFTRADVDFTPQPQPGFKTGAGIPVIDPLDIANRKKLIEAGQKVWDLNKQKAMLQAEAGVLKLVSEARNYTEKEQVLRSLYFHADLAEMKEQMKALDRKDHLIDREKAILFDDFKAEEDKPIITKQFLGRVLGQKGSVGYSSTLTDSDVTVTPSGTPSAPPAPVGGI